MTRKKEPENMPDKGTFSGTFQTLLSSVDELRRLLPADDFRSRTGRGQPV
jgi:hypothetical protein